MRKKNKAILGAVLSLFLTPLVVGQIYKVTDLGTLGGSFGEGTSVNILTQVAGVSSTADGFNHAFLWTKGHGMRDLGTLGGDSSRAYHLNGVSQVVGESTVDRDLSSHAFLWTQGSGMQDLGTLDDGCNSLAEGINLFGHVVGGSMAGVCDFSQFHGFLWTKEKGMKDLGTLGGNFSEAVAINAFDQVVGTSSVSDTDFHAFSWTLADGMKDLGTLGGCFSVSEAVNDLGHVIGESTTSCMGSDERPFLWTQSTGMKDLGPAPGEFGGLTAINIFDQVTGVFCPEPCSGDQHAFLWTKNSGWHDLNDLIRPGSGWVLTQPDDINEWGQISGYGFFKGEVHAFLLTPNVGVRTTTVGTDSPNTKQTFSTAPPASSGN